MLVHKKSMFDCRYCIKTQCDARHLEVFEENAPVNNKEFIVLRKNILFENVSLTFQN